jgi:hypothetical protein
MNIRNTKKYPRRCGITLAVSDNTQGNVKYLGGLD